MKTLPPITKTQKQIILLTLKFRFITTSQLQKYLNHKNHHRINEWLKDLEDKKYISIIKDSKDITKPHIYCLNSQSRHLLLENCDGDFLNRLYKEKSLSSAFKNHCLFILDIYLFFLSHKDKDSKLAFCTQQDFKSFDYLPEDLDVYIAVENKDGVKRYFLEVFDEYKYSAGKVRYSVRKYIDYCEDGSWQANTQDSSFPSILFVLSDERRKKHILHYGKAKLSKTFEDISFFLTTRDMICFTNNSKDIWQRIVTE